MILRQRKHCGQRNRSRNIVCDETLKELEKTFGKESVALERLLREKQQASDRYDELYRSYIRGYAGILAEEMTKTIGRHGSAACPVCGKRYCGTDPRDGFAVRQETTPDEKALKAAEDKRQAAEKTFTEANGKWESARTALEERTQDLLCMADGIFPEASPWTAERLRSDELTAYADGAVRKEAENAGKVKEYEKKALRKKEMLEEQQGLTEKENRLRKETTENGLETVSLGKDLERLTAEKARLEQTVKQAGMEEYPTRELAEKAASDADSRAALLQKQLEAANENLKNAETAAAGCKGRIGELEKTVANALREIAGREEAFEDARWKAGFETSEDYEKAMARLNGADGEAWIAERTKQDTGYRSETDQTRKTVASLEEKTKDLVRTDLRELNTALEANKAVSAELTETRKTHALRSEGHLRARDQIIRTARTEGKLREARKKIGHLNSIANGASGAGGKHTFDGYVYGRALGEILDRAGIYLQEMTGGHYRLMHDRESANAR